MAASSDDSAPLVARFATAAAAAAGGGGAGATRPSARVLLSQSDDSDGAVPAWIKSATPSKVWVD